MTSLDYAKLIRWLGWHRHGVALNKTQVQKLLFICYGLELVANRLLFEDDTPKLFPFGPVFPRSYRRSAYETPELSQEEKDNFASLPDTLRLITRIVRLYHNRTASQFTRWSHQYGTPWQKTIESQVKLEWGAEINQDFIKEYFTDSKWQMGL